MDKQTLRATYLQKRMAIDGAQKLKLDDLMLIQFQRLAFTDIHYLMSYWPILSQNEPNTHFFNGYLRHMLPDLQIAYPKSDGKTHQMEAVLTQEHTIYKPGAYQIMEPFVAEGQPPVMDPRELDLIFTPMIVCDIHGHRIGYGKGFYDRFLARCRPDVLKIGLSYFQPVDQMTGVHPFDIPLDYCITPDEIYVF